jgi:DNA topoisomerase IA
VHQLELLAVVLPAAVTCQTPTLGFCVERHQAIVAFQPEPFWVVRPSLSKVGGGARVYVGLLACFCFF